MNPVQLILNIFINRKYASVFWFMIFVISNLGWAVFTVNLTEALKIESRVVLIDPEANIMTLSGETFDRAKDLHRMCAEKATISLLSLNPEGRDYPRMFSAYFIGKSIKKANVDFRKVEKEFGDRNIHQKVEIDTIEPSSDKTGNTVWARVRGQIIMNGLVKGEKFALASDMELVLTMQRNPNIGTNSYAPYSVVSYTTKFSAPILEDSKK